MDITVCNTTEKRCSNQGQCIEALGEDFFCYCLAGLILDTFELQMLEQPSSVKRQAQSMFIFQWHLFLTGWTGDTCEINVDECENNPCENGGACMDIPGSFLCGCPMGRCKIRSISTLLMLEKYQMVKTSIISPHTMHNMDILAINYF